MWYKETKKAVAVWLDAIVKFKNPILEAIDGPVFNVGVNILDEKLLEKIPDGYDEEANKLAMAIVEARYDDAVDSLATIAAAAIPTPVIDGTEAEKEAYHLLFQAIAIWLIKPKPAGMPVQDWVKSQLKKPPDPNEVKEAA